MVSDSSREMHADQMARVVAPVATSEESWWIGVPREGWPQRCAHELRRMRDTKFGKLMGNNLASEFAAPEPRSRERSRSAYL